MPRSKNHSGVISPFVQDILTAVTPHLPSDTDPVLLWEATIRIVLRWIFVVEAEERHLFPTSSAEYSLGYGVKGWKRELARGDPMNCKTPHTGWVRFSSLCRLIHQGSSHPQLPMPPYGARFFEAGNTKTASGRILKCLEDMPGPSDKKLLGHLSGITKLLNTTPGEGQLDGLGRVYEELLELELRQPSGDETVQLRLPGNPWVSRTDLLAIPSEGFKGMEGKDSVDLIEKTASPGQWLVVGRDSSFRGGGRYYTPGVLVKPLVEMALDPLCHRDSAVVSPEELLSRRVLDPACGSGAFLVAALHYLANTLTQSVFEHNCLSPADETAPSKGWRGATCVRLTPKLAFETPLGPLDDGFKGFLQVLLRRHVVEHCLYGVDIDPVAVETARLSLWLETLDPSLPLTFLDHRVRPGNSLLGATLEDLDHYPIAAWNRRESSHTNPGILRIQSEHRTLQRGESEPALPLLELQLPRRRAFEGIRRRYRELQAVPAGWERRKQHLYTHSVRGSQLFSKLQSSLDAWCALWFWPDEHTQSAPGPLSWYSKDPLVESELIKELVSGWGFFHFPLEFPDAFGDEAPGDRGFDAVVTNPPWEVPRPDWNRFVKSRDPLLSCLNPSWAHKRSEELKERPDLKRAWQEQCNALKHWQRFSTLRNMGNPTPFSLQEGGDGNLYKLFLEQSLSLLKDTGRIAMLAPSGLYSDKGAASLRRHLMQECRFERLIGMENRSRLFPIDGRFKFCAVIAQKGGSTTGIDTAFLSHPGMDWEKSIHPLQTVPVTLLEKMNPDTLAIPELSGTTDATLLERIFDSGILPQEPPWRIRYRRELDLSNAATKSEEGEKHSALFAPPFSLTRVLDAGFAPVLQGGTFTQYRWRGQRWTREGGRGRWVRYGPQEGWEPRFVVKSGASPVGNPPGGVKIVVRRVARNSDEHTVIAALAPNIPCDDKAPTLIGGTVEGTLAALVVLNSFVFDYVARRLSVATNLDRHRLMGLPFPSLEHSVEQLWLAGACLGADDEVFAPLWLELARRHPWLKERPWQSWWPRDSEERRRLRVWAEVTVARLFGLTVTEMEEILAGCRLSAKKLGNRQFVRGLDPRGFWRTEKQRRPDRRLSVQVLEKMRGSSELPGEGPGKEVLPAFRRDAPGWKPCKKTAASLDKAEKRGARRRGNLGL